MKRTVKVALLSLLVFPGVGHLFLKKYTVAAGFIGSFVYLLMSLISEIQEKTQELMNSIIKGDIPMDVSHISQALVDSEVLSNTNMSSMSYILLFIWVLAAFDAYRIANKN